MTDQQLPAIAGLTQAVEKHTDQTIKAVQLIHQAREELETAQGSFLQHDEQAADSRKLAGLTVNQLQVGTVKQVRAEHGNVISPPTVSGSNSVIINQQATLTVTADSHLNRVTIADFTLTRPDGSTDTVMAVNGQATFTTPVTGAVGSEQTFKITAIDSLGNISTPAEYVISIIDNQAPVMDGFSYSVPSIAIRGETITARFLGATDPDGNDSQVTYRIVDTLGVTAGKTSGIGHNEAVTLTVDQISADMTGRITVKAVDAAGVQSGGVVIPLDLRAKAVVETPSAISPIDGSADMDRQPFLSWSSFVTNPSGFDTHQATRLQVATDSGFSNVVVDMTVGAVTTAQVDQPLQAGSQYYWRVQVQGKALGWSEWSDNRSFSTQAFTAAVGLLGGSGDDYFYDITVDSSGYIFAIGQEYSQFNNAQALITKYDSDLKLLKQVTLSENGRYPNTSFFRSIAINNRDHIFAVGYGGDEYSALIAKYDSNLNLLKQVTLGGYNVDCFDSVIIDDDNTLFVVGYEASSGSKTNGMIAKYDSDLNLLGQASLGGEGHVYFRDVALDNNGHVFVVGGEEFGWDSASALIAKYDSDLNFLKQASLDAGPYNFFWCITVDDSSHVFAAGTKGNSASNSKDLIVKYDYNLNIQKKISRGAGGVQDVFLDNNGHIVAAGGESPNALLAKYDINLTPIKAVLLDSSSSSCNFLSLSSSLNGNIFVAGYTHTSERKNQALIASVPGDINITEDIVPYISTLSWGQHYLSINIPSLAVGNPNLSVGNPNLTTGDPGLSIGNPNLTETRSEY